MKQWDTRLASLIDHTLLRSNATAADIDRMCGEAMRYRFAAAVVPPFFVPRAAELLRGSGIPVCSVVSFPFGAQAPTEKAFETENLLKAGAGEIDAVMNIGAFLSGMYGVVQEELDLISTLCNGCAVSKIIIETAHLDRDGIVRAAGMGLAAGFDFIKTSTGYGPRGASVSDVELVRSVVGTQAGVKASGGIRTRLYALELVNAGATRIGCSQSIDVISLGGEGARPGEPPAEPRA
jgi:deoxyribose-phosphate aldolase